MRTIILHYSAPPVIGGVEAVIEAHTRQLLRAGYPVTIVAGRGDPVALPQGVELVIIPEMDSRHPEILQASADLEHGRVPGNFRELVDRIQRELAPILSEDDVVVAHNLFSKHFNLPLTAALVRLVERGAACRWIAWCHDSSWTSPSSRSKVHEGDPWDLLRRNHPRVIPVAVSRHRQAELAELYQVPKDEIRVIYNGVDPESLLGLSPAGRDLVERLDLFAGDLVLLVPVRVTQAKNLELAIHVAAALKQQGIDPRMIVTGPPDPHDERIMAYYQGLRELRSQLGLTAEMRFVYELETDSGEPLRIGPEVVGELYRVSDALFMPSHREGFGMPVLEAGLAGIQVFSTQIPASVEIADGEVIFFADTDAPESVARRLLAWAGKDGPYQLRRKVRQDYTWWAIFQRDIQPLLDEECRE